MAAAGAVTTALSGDADVPELPAHDPTLRPGTEQADLVAALDGYVSDLAELRATKLPQVVIDPTIQALTAARESREVALRVAAAIDTLEHTLARSERVNLRWSGSPSSANIAQSHARMRSRRASLLATLTRTVGEIAEVYTKLLEVSASVDTVALHDGAALDIKSIDSSLDSLRSAVAEMEADHRTVKAEVLGDLFDEFATDTDATPDRVLATVLFTDIVGSTEQLASLGDHAWREKVAAHHDVIRTALDQHQGREIDTAGDGFFAIFDGPGHALACARAVVDAVVPLGIQIRAGLHTGECEIMGEKVGGLAVHIGARITSLAGPSEILVSSTVRDLTVGSGITFEDLGVHELKGIPDPWHLYRLLPSENGR
jgi:class 3 adenylate cyclase